MENKRYYLEVIEKDNNEELKSTYNLFKVNDKREDFLSISKNINCFIGANNSGKSRALRQISCPVKFELEVENTFSNFETLQNILSEYENTTSKFLGITALNKASKINIDFLSIKDIIDVKQNILNISNNLKTKISDNYQTGKNVIHNFEYTLTDFIEKSPTIFSSIKNKSHDKEKILTFLEIINGLLLRWQAIAIHNLRNSNNRIYIPTLRSLRPLNTEKDNLFKNRTIADYNLYNVDVFTGLDLYDRIQNMLLGYKKDRDNVGAFESFLSKNFFDGHDISLTTPKDKDVVHIKIGEEKEHEIYHVGDGIQQLIILLFPFFENRGKRDITICIEEPELFLHPKWQKIFIDTISQKEFENIHVFFTTHSNAFINHEAVDVYQVKKEIGIRYDGTINYGEVPILQEKNTLDANIANICGPILADKKELLAELGYQASDVLGHNYTLLVEGPSDKIFIERFISTYSNDKLQIDNHYNVLPFHGKGNLKKHYGIDNEPINLEKLNHNFGIVVDSDLNHTETNTLKNKLNSINKFFWCTHGRSIENTIPREQWIKILVDNEQVVYYDNNIKKEDLSKINSFEEERYSKVDDKKYGDVKSILNTLIELTEEQTNLLNEKITANNKFKKGYFTSNDNKIMHSDKVKIANKIISAYPSSQEELLSSPELAYYIPKLCKAIYIANGMYKEANEITEEYLNTAKTALEHAIKAETKRVKDAISGHQSKQAPQPTEA